MKRAIVTAGVLFLLVIISGCSTFGMNRYVAKEEAINTDKYAYHDENFTYDLETLQELAERFRLEELSTSNVNSIMKDEIKRGRFNEIIIYLRELQAEEEEEAAAFSERYLEALAAHVQRTKDPSEALVEDAVKLMQKQYELDPEDEEKTIRYANMLIDSKVDVKRGAHLLFDFEEHLKEQGEQPSLDLLLALAQAYYAVGDYEKSLARYEKLTTLETSDPTHFYRMSEVFAAMGDEEGERKALTKAFEPTSEFLGKYGDNNFSLYKDYLDESIDE
ncbi:tetratricopeptide repeat protein [Bacillus piscicola]|uniref:tetratricopeptide repeat protein n=1 Tax=Bacillus piscicola TaxID=1632684 RepID=UPI001F09FDDA|nr:tetratricopeptide repeat protein [Bacillus piscicola]